VLVVDGDTLRPVHLLDLVHQVLLRLAYAEDPQYLLRVRRTLRQLLTDLDVLTVLDQQTTTLRHRVGDLSEPSSGVSTSFRVLSVSSIAIRPAASEIGALPLADGPRRARPHAADRG